MRGLVTLVLAALAVLAPRVSHVHLDELGGVFHAGHVHLDDGAHAPLPEPPRGGPDRAEDAGAGAGGPVVELAAVYRIDRAGAAPGVAARQVTAVPGHRPRVASAPRPSTTRPRDPPRATDLPSRAPPA